MSFQLQERDQGSRADAVSALRYFIATVTPAWLLAAPTLI